MEVSLEWKIVVGQRRFKSGHRTAGGEEVGCNNHGNQVTDFLRSRNMTEDRHLWSLGMDRRLLAIYYIYVNLILEFVRKLILESGIFCRRNWSINSDNDLRTISHIRICLWNRCIAVYHAVGSISIPTRVIFSFSFEVPFNCKTHVGRIWPQWLLETIWPIYNSL